jgi:chromosome segregation ATPase
MEYSPINLRKEIERLNANIELKDIKLRHLQQEVDEKTGLLMDKDEAIKNISFEVTEWQSKLAESQNRVELLEQDLLW